MSSSKHLTLQNADIALHLSESNRSVEPVGMIMAGRNKEG
jgi:hypothetical protein